MRVYNPTDAPVVIDGEGHTLAGREKGDVEQTEQVKSALAEGRLVEPDETEKKTDESKTGNNAGRGEVK